MRRRVPTGIWVTALLLTVALAATACGKKKAPIARPSAPPPPVAADTGRPAAPEAVREAAIVPPEPVIQDEAVSSGSLDDLNRTSPLKPVFFELDSSDLSSEGRLGRTPGAFGPSLSDFTGTSGRSAAHGQLRQGVPV